MSHWTQDLRTAARSLSRQPAFTLVALLTLALGIGATTAIFSVVYGIVLKPLPYPRAERLVAFGQTARSAPQEPVDGSSSYLNFLDWQRAARTIPMMALYTGGRSIVTLDGEADVMRVGMVTPAFFDVFQQPPMIGRTFTADETRDQGPRAIVISHGLWQERFGGRPDVLGATLEIGGAPWPIVGVAPPGFDFPNGARLWHPLQNDNENCGRACVYLNGVGRLADDVDAAAAQDEMTAIAAALERDFPQANTDVTVKVQTLHERTVGHVQQALVVLLAAVIMVLLIACANVANLLLVRGASRRGELAVRTALGAGRRDLVSHLLTEHLLLALGGGALGLLLTVWGIDALKAMAPTNLPRLDEVALNAPTLIFACALAIATTIVFGAGPALQLSRTSAAQVLGQRGTIGPSRGRGTRAALLAAEVGLSVVLLLGAGLLLRSLVALTDTPLGFNPAGLTTFTISLPPAGYPGERVIAAHEALDEQLAAMPGVTRVARISGLPLGPSENVMSFSRTDQPPPAPGAVPSALFRVVDADYFRTLGIPVVAGRAFEASDRMDHEPVVIVSERMAEVFWPGVDPVGRSIQISGREPTRVVGVVGNVRSQALTAAAEPEMYIPHAQTAVRTVTYVLASAIDAPQTIAAARDVVRRMDRRLPLIGPEAMADVVDAQLARPRFYGVMLTAFAGLALVLAAVGLYGVVAYIVARRTREIGVRMALGAGRAQVLWLVLRQGLGPAAVGLVAGIALAATLGRVIEGLLYGVKPLDPVTYVTVTAALFAVVIGACLIPARRATAVAPVDALRCE